VPLYRTDRQGRLRVRVDRRGGWEVGPVN
jgi:hypothetical protein